MRRRSCCLALVIATAAPAQQWQRLPGSSTPPPQFHDAMTFDADRGRTICVAVEIFLPLLVPVGRLTTWELVEPGRWLLRETPGATPPISTFEPFQIAWHPELRRTMLCNGQGETWLYDGSIGDGAASWEQVATAGWTSTTDPSLAWDAIGGTMLLFDHGQLHTFDVTNGTWNAVGGQVLFNGGPVIGGRIGHDPQTASTLLFGGGNPFASSNATWSWSGTAWTQLSPANPPTDRVEHQLTLDPTTQTLV